MQDGRRISKKWQGALTLEKFVYVGTTEADARGHIYNPLRTLGFTPFSKYYVFLSKFLPSISNSRYVKPSISKFSIKILGISTEMLGFSFDILGFSFKILGISKICDKRVPYKYTPILIQNDTTSLSKCSLGLM